MKIIIKLLKTFLSLFGLIRLEAYQILFGLFLTLKLCHIIDWNWRLIFLPLCGVAFIFLDIIFTKLSFRYRRGY